MHERATLLFTFFLAAVAYAQAPATKPPSSEDALVANLAGAKWVAPKVPEIPLGVMISPIGVDPKTDGAIGYAKFPPGYVFPQHWHSHTEYTVLLSGKASFTLDGKTHELMPGSYVVIPAKAHHGVTCGQGSECVLLTRRAGPTDYHFVGK
jgi:quercetin dioxygenase-like cupin family protein